jgi:hypothetical protein
MDETLYNRVDHTDGRVEFIPKRAADLDWVPVDGNAYFKVNDDGFTSELDCDDDNIDHDYIKFHNMFQTKQQSQKASALMRRSNAIIRACLLVDPDFDLDFPDDSSRWTVQYDTNASKWLVVQWNFINPGAGSVSTLVKAKQVRALLTKWGVV